MSRAYRIRVRETLRRVIRAEDHVSSQLEILEILPADQMADILAAELEDLGFEREGNIAERRQGNVTAVIDLETGEVTVRGETSHEVALASEQDGYTYERSSKQRRSDEEKLRKQVLGKLEQDVEKQAQELQNQVTDELEAELGELRSELDKAVNRATASALKQKAARLGQIKEMTEDTEAGSLTIVVEV